MIYNLLFCASFNFMVLLVWQHSTAIVEYGRLLGLKKLLKDDEFQAARKEANFRLNYPNFLLSKYPNFFTKLLQCPVCTTVWLAGLSWFWVGFKGVFIVFMMTILFYYTFIYLSNPNSGGLKITKAN